MPDHGGMWPSVLAETLIAARDRLHPGLWKPNDLGVRMLATVDEMVADGVAVYVDGVVMYGEHASMVAVVCYRLGLPLRNFTDHLERSGWRWQYRATRD